MIRAPIATALVLLAVAGVTAGCRERHHAAWERPTPGGDTAGSAAAARPRAVEPGALRSVQSAPVELWQGAGDRPFEVSLRSYDRESGHARRFGSITLSTALRTRALGQYPCTSCHLGRKVAMADDRRVGDAHQDIQPVHPEQTGALCSTCHSADNVELLTLKTGERATLDESYRLCAQCHFAQVDDWAKGAHGKRLDGWQGRRVVMGCPDCHDPHQPALQPRIPFRAPQIERNRSYHK